MNRILSSLAVLAVAAPASAFAAEPTYYYPRIPGDATNLQVEYAPGSNANVVGGGAVTFRGGDSERALMAFGPGREQAAAGQPVFVGVDDGRPVFAYVPTASDAGRALANRNGNRAPRG